MAAGMDKRRMASIERGWLQATGVQMRVAIEIDDRLALKRGTLGALVALRADDAAADAKVIEDAAEIRALLEELPPGQSLVVGGVALPRTAIGKLLPPELATIPAAGDSFNLACIAGSVVTNGPPLISISTNDVMLQAAGILSRSVSFW